MLRDARFCCWFTAFLSAPVSLPPFASRIPALFAVDALLLLLELGGFSRRQLAALHSLRDAVLLIFLALAYFARPVMLHGAIVLVVVDLVRQVILLVVQLAFGQQL